MIPFEVGNFLENIEPPQLGFSFQSPIHVDILYEAMQRILVDQPQTQVLPRK